MVYENKMLKEVCAPKREEVAGGWRKSHNEFNLYSLPDIVRMIKSRMMRRVGRVALMWMR
jgi:hypothetical protein